MLVCTTMASNEEASKQGLHQYLAQQLIIAMAEHCWDIPQLHRNARWHASIVCNVVEIRHDVLQQCFAIHRCVLGPWMQPQALQSFMDLDLVFNLKAMSRCLRQAPERTTHMLLPV